MPTAIATALPASVQGVLAARVDRLAPKDRGLLQAASVIGRRFDPDLLAMICGEDEIDAQLDAILALDLIRRENRSSNYEFKHALVRDALYQSLLTDARTSLHLKVAEEIERRSSNRLAEVAEVLAYHYSQTNHTDKAFTYLSMAGSKSLNVYSLDEAAIHFSSALALLDKNPNCASDDHVAELFAPYALLMNLNGQINIMIDVLERHLVRIDRLHDDPKVILIRHHYVFALFYNARYREAAAAQSKTSSLAARLGDSKSKAYSLANEIIVSTITSSQSLHEFEALKDEAIAAASETADAYIQGWTRWVIGWEWVHRGRMTDARESARELMRVGRLLNDPRSTGFGLYLLTWIAMISDSYAEALDYSEQSMTMAVAPLDHAGGFAGKACALVLLRRLDEGGKLLEENYRHCVDDGRIYNLAGPEGVLGGKATVSYLIKKFSNSSKGNAYRLRAHQYLDDAPLGKSAVQSGGASRRPGANEKAKKKRALAIQHLTEARQILSQFGPTPILARIDTALAELR